MQRKEIRLLLWKRPSPKVSLIEILLKHNYSIFITVHLIRLFLQCSLALGIWCTCELQNVALTSVFKSLEYLVSLKLFYSHLNSSVWFFFYLFVFLMRALSGSIFVIILHIILDFLLGLFNCRNVRPSDLLVKNCFSSMSSYYFYHSLFNWIALDMKHKVWQKIILIFHEFINVIS